MTPRILHIINNLDDIGGAELALVRLLEARDRGRYRHEVLTLLELDRLAPRLRAADVPVSALGLWRRDGGRARRVLRAAARPRVDLYVGWLYYSNLTASALGVLHGAPVVWNIRHSLHDTHTSGASTRLSIAVSTRLAHQPASIVFNSATSAGQHAGLGWPRQKMRVIPAGVDVARYRPDDDARARARAVLGVPEGTWLIGRFGRHHPLKGYETLLRAFAGVPREAPALLLLGGRDVDASNEALVREIAALGLGDRVRLIGEQNDLPGLLPAFDLCVSSSHSESFPNVVAEAMACGVPCVVTDVGDSAAIVGDTGWVVPGGDAGALGDGIARALTALRTQADARRVAARARVCERLSMAATVRAYDEVFAAYVEPG